MLLKGTIKSAKKGKTSGLLLKIQERGILTKAIKVKIKGGSIKNFAKDPEKIKKLTGKRIRIHILN